MYYAIIKLFEDLICFFISKEEFLVQMFLSEKQNIQEICEVIMRLKKISSKLANLKYALRFTYEDFDFMISNNFYSRVVQNKNVS